MFFAFYICESYAQLSIHSSNMEISAINQRIYEVIQFLGLTPTAFADEIGIQRSGLSHILKGRNRPSLDVVQKIVARYPDINLAWLVNGTGNLSLSTPSVINLRQKTAEEPKKAQEENGGNSLKNTLFDFPQVEETAEKSPKVSPEVPTTRTTFSHEDFQVKDAPSSGNASSSTAPLEDPKSSVSHFSFDSPEGIRNKKITKIVVFYNDHTFEEFSR